LTSTAVLSDDRETSRLFIKVCQVAVENFFFSEKNLILFPVNQQPKIETSKLFDDIYAEIISKRRGWVDEFQSINKLTTCTTWRKENN
jgi:hypothetical protein